MIESLTAQPTPDEAAREFGRLVRHHRTRIGLTQRELADFSTVSVRAIRNLEQGRATRPRQNTVELIAEGLRLGPKARAALESAAQLGRSGWPLKADYEERPPRPPGTAEPLIGRGPQSAALTAELAGGHERLAHVVGLSGVGKTRFALEVAARLHADADFPVLWAPRRAAHVEYVLDDGAEGLAPLVRRCANALFGAPAERDGRAELASLVGDGPALLVLDGADGRSPHPETVDRLLHDCPRLRLLIASPAPFGLPRERVFLLEPLPLPEPRDAADAAALERVPSAALLLHHVRRIRPGYTPAPDELGTLARICTLLDGLPSALRAAASWLLVYDLETLHACLADGPESLLGQLAAADGDCPLPAALAALPGRLRAPAGRLLSDLCDLDGDFGLADVMALTGGDLSDSGRMVRELMLSGAVRAVHGGGQARFAVLNVLRAALRPRAATAAGLPRQLPQIAAPRVSHGGHEHEHGH